MERFWSKVDKSGSCWTWRGYRNRRGADIARAYGVCKDTVYAILDGRTWARTETAA